MTAVADALVHIPPGILAMPRSPWAFPIFKYNDGKNSRTRVSTTEFACSGDSLDGWKMTNAGVDANTNRDFFNPDVNVIGVYPRLLLVRLVTAYRQGCDGSACGGEITRTPTEHHPPLVGWRHRLRTISLIHVHECLPNIGWDTVDENLM